MREQTFLRPLLFMMAGLIVWAAHFGAIYAINSVACTRGYAGTTVLGFGFVPVAITVATIVAVVALGLVMLGIWRGGRPRLPEAAAPRTLDFMRHMTLAAVAMGLLAVVWDAIPAYVTPPCA